MKKLLLAVLAICLACSLAACSTAKENGQDIQSQRPANFYALGAQTLADLNGDGTAEDIYYGLDDFIVNGVSYKELINEDVYQNGPMEDNFIICDINQNDMQKEIGLKVMGPSDDCEVYFYTYDGEKVYLCGVLPSAINDISADFDGQGHIKGDLRLSIFQTWWANATWELINAELVLVEQDVYETLPVDQEYTLTANLPVYKTMQDPEPTITITPQKVKLPATDNKNWVRIEAADGTKGWIYIQPDSFMYIVSVEKDADQVFSDLVMAD